MNIPANLSPSELLAFVIEWLMRALAEWKAARAVMGDVVEQPGAVAPEAGRLAGGRVAGAVVQTRSAREAGRRPPFGAREGHAGGAAAIARAARGLRPQPRVSDAMTEMAGWPSPTPTPTPTAGWRGGAIRVAIFVPA